MQDVTITRKDSDTHGEYRAKVDGHDETGELTYRKEADGQVLVADHTFVPPSLRGKSLAGKLVEALIADAREEGFKIKPVCSYVVTAFQRNPEWSALKA
ncbi:N-acetyltransferase [Croceicoccus ponticola]|uniref:N-acetyltransferase n=1 Tax=Croceicoccus ponticola TaxID=2217664 RepID=A0A437GYN9_9SPHN|nr:GNAT family N-acetyltransferase [Croceicoccus ponticola]RVQ67791.1 N-acetyltransferase [Croceicoccus ponticola]